MTVTPMFKLNSQYITNETQLKKKIQRVDYNSNTLISTSL